VKKAVDRALENLLWKMLWTCHLTSYRMNVFSHDTLCSLVENSSILMEAVCFSEVLLHVQGPAEISIWQHSCEWNHWCGEFVIEHPSSETQSISVAMQGWSVEHQTFAVETYF